MSIWKEVSKTQIFASKEFKKTRNAYGFTVRQLAHAAGISPTMIWNIESGLKPVPAKIAKKIDAIFAAEFAKCRSPRAPKKHWAEDRD